MPDKGNQEMVTHREVTYSGKTPLASRMSPRASRILYIVYTRMPDDTVYCIWIYKDTLKHFENSLSQFGQFGHIMGEGVIQFHMLRLESLPRARYVSNWSLKKRDKCTQFLQTFFGPTSKVHYIPQGSRTLFSQSKTRFTTSNNIEMFLQ